MIEPVIKRLDELSGGDVSFQLELIQIFLAESEKNLNEIKHHISQNDLKQAARSVHAIKGAALNIGSNEMGALLERLEKRFAAGDSAPTLLQESVTSFATLHRQLNDFLAQNQS